MAPLAIAIGMPVSDYLLNYDRIPAHDRPYRLLAHSWQYGGKVSTGICAAGRLGVSCGIAAVVGDDADGHAQKRDFARNGVDTAHLILDPAFETPYCIALSDRESGQRSFSGPPRKTRRIEERDLRREYFSDAQFLLAERGDEATRAAARWVRAQGGQVVFDADWYDERQEAFIPLCDAFIPSEYYYHTRYGTRDVLDCCREMADRGPHTVIITLGDQGCAGISRGRSFRLPAYPVPVVDTTGAGDVFHGAYLFGMTMGWDSEDCARFASATSAINCCAIGGRAALPTREMVEHFMKYGELPEKEIAQRVAFYARNPYIAGVASEPAG